MHEVSESQSGGNAHYTSSLINHQGTETFCNLLLIDSPLMSPADAIRADCIITGWELQFHILAESFFFLLSFQLEPTLFGSNQHHPNQYIVCFLLFVDTPTPIQTEVIILHSYAHVHQCQSAPLRSWIQFQGCETL